MRIGGIGNVYPTYVYNPNVVSAKSMDKLSKISDDVLDKKVDYSETVAQENQNPLKKGQTIDFESMLDRQMRQGQNRAARIMPNGIAPAADAAKDAVKKEETEITSFTKREPVEETRPETENDSTVMQMQRAIQAYEMFMTA